jgi:hypothetical protein
VGIQVVETWTAAAAAVLDILGACRVSRGLVEVVWFGDKGFEVSRISSERVMDGDTLIHLRHHTHM